MGFRALHLSPSPNGFTSNVGIAQNLSNYRLNRVSRLRVYAKKEEQDPKKSTQSLFSSITEALDFSQVRSQEDAQLLEDARETTKSGSQMSREQVINNIWQQEKQIIFSVYCSAYDHKKLKWVTQYVQYGALRRKIGGTYKDFFKSYIDGTLLFEFENVESK